MARYDHLPIWKAAMDLAVLSRQSEQFCSRSRRGYSLRVLERAVLGFPRYQCGSLPLRGKYALGSDLRGYSWVPPGAFPSFHPVVR